MILHPFRHNIIKFLASLALLFAVLAPLQPQQAAAATAQVQVPQGFTDTAVISNLNGPTAVRFAPDGSIFIAQKEGTIYRYASLSDTNPVKVADLTPEVMNYWDRGLLGLAIDPGFPAKPYIYIGYTYDAPPGKTAPYWNDACSDPNGNGCLVYNRVSKLTLNASNVMTQEQVLISDWCQQYPSHSIGNLMFGPDGALYISGGEGANFNQEDWGQLGGNPCNDPVNEGGALRSQSVRRAAGEPVVLGGSVLRVDPATGNALPDNPLYGGSRTDDDRIIAHGFRNPFRFTIRPGTNELWVGDVGYNTWEEINRIANPKTLPIPNYGWPCYEGNGPQPGYQSANLPLCTSLYNLGTATPPYYTYIHQGTSSTTGVAFYIGSTYPQTYNNALFFADYSAAWLKVMFPGSNGLPDPNNILTFETGINPVDLQVGPNGDIFYANLISNSIHRIQYFSNNTPPKAVATADVSSGQPPLTVHFSGATSSDPDPGDTLTYSWDLNGDGTYGDATNATPQYTYTAKGVYNVSLKVTDNHGASSFAGLTIAVGTAPVASITTPQSSLTYKVGDQINFAGQALDSNNNKLPASDLSWQILLHHCFVADPSNCHVHFLQNFTGVEGGVFTAPDHEYPSYLEIDLTATESAQPANWYNASWTKRDKLTFNNAASTEDLTNFPVLIKLDSTKVDYSKMKPDGSDLRFTDSTNTLLSYEIESFNPSGTSYVWVKVPKISAGSGTDYIYLYYGNPNAAAAQNKADVWSNNYKAVWHLNADISDSTVNAKNGTNVGGTFILGQIANSLGLNGTSGHAVVTASADIGFSKTQSYTLSSWVNIPALQNKWQGVVTKSRDKSPWYGIWLDPNNKWVFGGSSNIVGPVATTGWHQATIVQDGTAGKRYLYIDGVQVANGVAVAANGTGDLWMGGAAAVAEYFKGNVDDVSLATVARSANWLLAQYKSTKDNFISYAVDEATQLSNTQSVNLQPQTTTVNLSANQPGLQLIFYSEPGTAPFSRQIIVKGATNVSAPTPQTVNGITYDFTSWSDGGAQTHQITAPDSNPINLTATYTPRQASAVTWNSYATQTQSGSPQATVQDTSGTQPAQLSFYESANDGGVDQGTIFSIFNAIVHPQAFNNVQNYWAEAAGWTYPYAGKSTIGRGVDSGETNTPSPTGVFDLQMHPPNSAHTTVAAFTVPVSGNYTVSNLGVRRVNVDTAQSVRLKVFSTQKVLLDNLQATSTAWVNDANTYPLGTLNAGDKIYFAVDPDGSYAWDATEINWTITKN